MGESFLTPLMWVQELKKLYKIFDALPEGVYVISKDYTIEFLNSTFRKTFGNVEGEKCYRAFYGRDSPCSHCDIPEVMKGRIIDKVWTYPHTQKTYHLTSIPLQNPDGSFSKLMISRDITEQKRIQEEYDHIFNAIGIVVTIIDPRYNILEVNSTLSKLIGKSKKELIGKKCYEIFHNSKKPLENCPVKKLITSKLEKPIMVELEALGKVMLVSCAPIIKNGEIQKIIHIGIDATQCHRVENELNYLIQNMKDSIFKIDLDGNFTYANKAAEEITGFSVRELLGKNMYELIAQDYHEMIKERMKIRVAGKPLEQPFNFEIITKKGERKWVELTTTPIYNEKGELMGVQGIARDVTERKKMEEAIRKSQELYSSLINDAIDSLSSGIIILDKNFKIVWVNKAICTFFGIERDKLIGKDKREIIKRKIKFIFENPDLFENIVLKTYENNTYVENFECHVLSGEGREERYLIHWSTPIMSGALKGGRIEHYYDITELKKMEKELIKAYEELKELDRIKKDLIANISHELKTPITIIKGLMELGLEEDDKNKRQKYLKRGFRALNRLIRLINNLIEASQIQKREYKLNIEKIDLVDSILIVLNEVKHRAKEKRIEIEINIDEELRVLADPKYLYKALYELIDNAIKFNRRGGIVRISALKKKDDVEICVFDSGIGIKEECIDKIFDKFYQSEMEPARRFNGMGMGLAICKDIIEAHGGRIWAESCPEEGSKFYFTLPIAK